jgi:hypothetical protein
MELIAVRLYAREEVAWVALSSCSMTGEGAHSTGRAPASNCVPPSAGCLSTVSPSLSVSKNRVTNFYTSAETSVCCVRIWSSSSARAFYNVRAFGPSITLESELRICSQEWIIYQVSQKYFLFNHLNLLQSSIFSSGLQTKIVNAFLMLRVLYYVPSILSFLIKLWNSYVMKFRVWNMWMRVDFASLGAE